MKKLLVLALLTLSMPVYAANKPVVDKKLINKDTYAWIKANQPSKDNAVTAAIGIFIAKGVWKAPSGAPAMSKQKTEIIKCVNEGAALIKSKSAQARGVAESIFACSIYKGYVKN